MTDSILDQTDTTTENIESYLALMPETQRDAEALAKAKYNADNHIKILETRMDELRKDYLKERETNQTGTKLQDLISRLETQQLASSEQPNANEVREPTIDLNEIDKRLDQKLVQFELSRKEQANANLVKDKLKERFGSNYAPAVKQQITELGLTEEDFNLMARKSPEVILRSLGVDNTRSESYQNPVRGSSNFNPKTEPKRTWSYYQALKKENPKMYLDPKTTVQMEKDYAALGEAFEDGDFAKYGR